MAKVHTTMMTAPMTARRVTSATSTPSDADAVVDRLLHQDRHDDAAAGADQRQREREERALAQLGAARAIPAAASPGRPTPGASVLMPRSGRGRRPRPGAGTPAPGRAARRACRGPRCAPSAMYTTSSARAMVDGRLATMTVVMPSSSVAQPDQDERLRWWGRGWRWRRRAGAPAARARGPGRGRCAGAGRPTG